jgi:hypothetical protein
LGICQHIAPTRIVEIGRRKSLVAPDENPTLGKKDRIYFIATTPREILPGGSAQIEPTSGTGRTARSADWS